MSHDRKTAGSDLERGPNGSMSAEDHEERMRNVLTQIQTISPDLFEKVYLGPKNDVSGDLRKTFANPTPVAVLGFAVGLFPLSIEFMSWRGSGALGTPTTTCSIWFGGLLLIIGGIGEFILGNTFPFVVFFGYGAHFLTYATTFMPFYGAVAFAAQGDAYNVTPTFAASFAFYPLALAMLSFVFLICSTRTNGIFVVIFICATIGFSFAAASLWYTAAGNALGATFLVATGAAFFAADVLGWYLLLAIMIQIMELPIPDLPVFDLSTIVKARPRGVKRE